MIDKSQALLRENRGMSKKNQHVVPHQDGWAVKSEGGQRASSVHERQSDAIAAARQTAINQRGELFIHGRGVRHGSMRQPTAVEVTATGGQTDGPEPQRQARGGAGGRPER